MEDSLKSVISDIRVFLYGGMNTLPLALAGTLLLIGLFTAHYAILFFLVGYLILVPAATFGINGLVGKLVSEETLKAWGLRLKRADICRVVTPFQTLQGGPSNTGEETIVFSEWLSMIAFFSGYVMNNSWAMYQRDALNDSAEVQSKVSTQGKVATRKTQTLLSLLSVIAFTLAVIYYRSTTGCEGMVQIGLTLAAFGAAGWGWYQWLSSVAQPDQLSDLFGIANRILPAGATVNGPMACIPVGDAPV